MEAVPGPPRGSTGACREVGGWGRGEDGPVNREDAMTFWGRLRVQPDPDAPTAAEMAERIIEEREEIAETVEAPQWADREGAEE